MKIFLIFLLGLMLGSALLPAADPSVESASNTAPPAGLEQLNAAYERKRAEALRPVTAWYRAELAALGKKIRAEGEAVQEAERTLAKTFWEDDQPELKAALWSQEWVWRSEENTAGVPLVFAADGGVRHVGLHGTWTITGPNEVTVQPEDDGAYLLRFNASLTLFVGDRRGVSGERLPRKARGE